MKKIYSILLFISIYSVGVGLANESNDSILWIENVKSFIDNAQDCPINGSEVFGIWFVDEWQKVHYMPSEDFYDYFFFKNVEANIFVNQQGDIMLNFESYDIRISDITKSIITIPNQQVDNPFETKDFCSGRIVLINEKLYFYLHIVGTQDFEVEFYGIGKRRVATDNADNIDIGVVKKTLNTADKIISNGTLQILLPDGRRFDVLGRELRNGK